MVGLGRFVFLSLLLCLIGQPVAAIEFGSSYDLNQRGVEALNDGQSGQAVELLRAALRVDPGQAVIRRNLAVALLSHAHTLLEQGDFNAALQIIFEGRDLNDDPRFDLLRGQAFLLQRDYGPAEVALQDVLARDPDSVSALRMLGEVHYATGRLDDAVSTWRRALKKQPENTELQIRIKRVEREVQVEAGMENSYSSSFVLSFQGERHEALGQEILDILERAYADLGSDFLLYPTFQIPVLLYTQQDFSRVTEAPGWAAGSYDGKIRIPLGGLLGVDERLQALLYHEYAHVLVRKLSRGNCPVWLNEGLAVMAGRRHFAPPLSHLAQARKENRLLDWAGLQSAFGSEDRSLVQLAYEQSFSMTEFLAETYGWYRVVELLRELGQGREFFGALHKVYLADGLDRKHFYRLWRAVLRP